MTSTTIQAPDAARVKRVVTFTNSAPYFAALLVLAAVAFWPSYLSTLGAATGYMHFHAITAAAWMLMLIVQPLAIRNRQLGLHRAIGRASYVIAPVVVIGMVLLAHSRTRSVPPSELAGFYVPLSLTVLFAVAYALAIVNRRTTALHARFMVCTALPLIDPVVVRLLFRAYATPSFRYQWITFGLTDLVFLALMWRERHARAGRAVFPAMLLLFALAQLVFLLDFFDVAPWQAFMRWFAALPLT